MGKKAFKHFLQRIGLGGALKATSRWRWMRKHGGEKTLLSGITCYIKCFDDWLIFHEIFELKCYHLAIQSFLEVTAGDSEVRVLDCGGNVGFFALSVADAWIQSGRLGQCLHITSVEASPSNCKAMELHRMKNSHLGFCWEIVPGLAGKRSGTEWLGTTEGHYALRVADSVGTTGFRAEYVDLDALRTRGAVIHMLKCDIEGSEGALLENYPELISSCELVCIEIHGDKKTAPISHRIVSLGLINQTTLVEESEGGADGPTSTILFSK